MVRYVVHFLDEWLDFRYAEWLSLLQLHRLDVTTVMLTHNRQRATEVSLSLSPFESQSLSQSQSVFSDENLLTNYISYLRDKEEPEHFMIVELPNDDVVKSICSRAVLVKGIYELWAKADSLAALVQEVSVLESSFLSTYLSVEKNYSWSVQVLTFGKTFTMKEKEQVRLHFKPILEFPGPVKINSPDIELWVVLNYQGKPDYSRKLKLDSSDPVDKSESPSDSNIEVVDCNNIQKPSYFGRKVCDGGMREELRKYDLKKRIYLGPTSLDDALALILCNIAGVKRHMMAYEPFIGTGSIAIALEHFGSWVMGSDIDPRVLRGDMYAGKDIEHLEKNRAYYDELNRKKKSEEFPKDFIVKAANKNEQNVKLEASLNNIHKSTRKSCNDQGCVSGRDVFANFEAYNLPLPELIRMDHHLLDRHLMFPANASNGFFDVIVTDPPYGIRAGGRKSGKKEPVSYVISEERRYDHIPSTQNYPVEEVMLDLLHTSASTLVIGGVLVYLLPTPYNFNVTDLPRHPCLELVDVCHQHLSTRHGRRAVVMKKTKPFSLEASAEFENYKRLVLAKEDDGFGSLIDKLQLALAADAHENENVVKIIGSCGGKRRESKERRRKQREDGVMFETDKIRVKLLSKKQLKRMGNTSSEVTEVEEK